MEQPGTALCVNKSKLINCTHSHKHTEPINAGNYASWIITKWDKIIFIDFDLLANVKNWATTPRTGHLAKISFGQSQHVHHGDVWQHFPFWHIRLRVAFIKMVFFLTWSFQIPISTHAFDSKIWLLQTKEYSTWERRQRIPTYEFGASFGKWNLFSNILGQMIFDFFPLWERT